MTQKNYVNRKNLDYHLANGLPIVNAVNRGTGKTVASILSALGSALHNCGTPVVPHDPDINSTRAYSVRARLAADWVRRAKEMVNLLGLSGYHFAIDRGCVIQVTCTFAESI